MPHFSAAQQKAIDTLARDLDHIFGARLQSLVAYPGNQADGSVHSCAIVDGLGFRDLVSCLPQTESWHRRGAAVPLMLASGELERTVDIFPLEYSSILADYVVVRGADPFLGVSIPAEDVRRATEGQAKSHLIHLREAFLESHGETTRIGRLIAASAAPLRALLTNIARLNGGVPGEALSDQALAAVAEARMGISATLIREVLASSSGGHSTIADPSALLAHYIEAAQKNLGVRGSVEKLKTASTPNSQLPTPKRGRWAVSAVFLGIGIWFLGIGTWDLGVVAAAQTAPPPLTDTVNDFAQIIDAGSKAELDKRIRALKDTTGDVIIVATVPTFQPYGSIEEYAVKMFENGGRGIGDKSKDNGLLIVVAKNDRKVRIEVGYDLEGFIPDGYAGQTIREAIGPAFREEQYGAGLLTATTRIINRIAEKRGVTIPDVPVTRANQAARSRSRFPFGLMFWIVVAIIIMLRNNRRRRRRYWGHGPWSNWTGGVGPFGGGGFGGGSGGSFGGGGGGFGGGGFGGFSGGSSGGGGSSSSW